MNKKFTQNNDEDEDPVFPTQKQPLGFSAKSQSFYNFTVHLSEEIKDASYYTKVFDLMLEAGENDIIDLMIASPGGDLDGLNMLLEGMRLTDAHVRAILIGACHSAASILAMNAHDVVVTDSCTMLVHGVRTGFGGKMVDLDAFTAHSKKVTDKLLRQSYEGFLTPDELKEVIHGRELWLDADEVRERFERRQAYLEGTLAEAAVEVKPKRSSKKKKVIPVEEPTQA